LPLHLLVAVRVQLARHRHGAREDLRACNRVNERADVREECGASRIEKPVELGHRGVKRESASVGSLGRERKQAGARQSKIRSGGGIGGVSRIIGRDDHVVRVVAAVQEKTHERFVVGGNGTAA
jgi:hypothetical protein